mmetsp:Transcript_20873/g.18230  ORF Transcript_20873/g.18230 Transcript_20873/m.18230 type:complete len:182 (-) Transcript_20873:940-1485(-)
MLQIQHRIKFHKQAPSSTLHTVLILNLILPSIHLNRLLLLPFKNLQPIKPHNPQILHQEGSKLIPLSPQSPQSQLPFFHIHIYINIQHAILIHKTLTINELIITPIFKISNLSTRLVLVIKPHIYLKDITQVRNNLHLPSILHEYHRPTSQIHRQRLLKRNFYKLRAILNRVFRIFKFDFL